MRKAIFLIILVLLAGTALYVYWYYFNVKSEGARGGFLQKFSRKGNVFKTYEGEMVQSGFGTRRAGNFNAQYFYFSVASEQLADSLDKCVNKEVRLHYVQYRRSLPWRGENYNGKNEEQGQYMVDKIEEVREATNIY